MIARLYHLSTKALAAVGATATLSVLPLIFSQSAQASDGFHFSGFATVGAGKLSRDDVRFVDYDGDWSFKTDTVLGAQAQIDLPKGWSATTQVISKGFTFGQYSDFEPMLEWLFASYQMSPETRVRVGRMRTPLYFYSNSLEVGYSYAWVRPPVDTYAFVLEPLSNFNGADISTIIDLGDSDLDLNFYTGATHGTYQSFDLDFNFVLGSSINYRISDWQFRYSVTFTRADASSSSLKFLEDTYNSLAGVHPIFAEIADSHSTEDGWFHYHGFGIKWDNGDWSVTTEQYVTLGPNEDFANDAYGWYLSVAHQMGKFTPYAVTGYYKNIFADEIGRLLDQSKQIVPEGFNEQLDQLRAANQKEIDDFNESGHTYTAGVRYDFHDQASLKVEVQYFDSTALLSGENLKQLKKQDAVLTSIAIDLVF